MLANATFKVLSISARLKLNESLLLVDSLALLLDSLLELLACSICVSSVISVVLISVSLSCWLFGLLSTVLVGTLC